MHYLNTINTKKFVKVSIIRNLKGVSAYGCSKSSPSYSKNVDLITPSNCGSNTYDIYDIARPHTVRHIMNFYNAPATDFIPYLATNLTSELPLDCEMVAGDHLVVVWAQVSELQ
jgi:hypothetical protein